MRAPQAFEGARASRGGGSIWQALSGVLVRALLLQDALLAKSLWRGAWAYESKYSVAKMDRGAGGGWAPRANGGPTDDRSEAWFLLDNRTSNSIDGKTLGLMQGVSEFLRASTGHGKRGA